MTDLRQVLLTVDMTDGSMTYTNAGLVNIVDITDCIMTVQENADF